MNDARLTLIKLRRGSEYMEQTKKLGNDIYTQAKLVSSDLCNIAREICPGKMNLTKLDRCAKIVIIYMYLGAIAEQYDDEAVYCIMNHAYDSYFMDSVCESCPQSIDSFQAEMLALEGAICHHPTAGTYENFYIVSRYIAKYASLGENLTDNSKLIFELAKCIRAGLGQDVTRMTYEQYIDFCMIEIKNAATEKPGFLNRFFAKKK